MKYLIYSFPCLGKWSDILGVNWGWSPNWRREAPEIWSQSPNWKRSPRLSGEGSGERAWEPSQENFENSYLKPCNLVYSSTFQAHFYLSRLADLRISRKWTHTTFRSQPNSAIYTHIWYVFENVVNSLLGSRAKPKLTFGAFSKNAFFWRSMDRFFQKYTWYGHDPEPWYCPNPSRDYPSQHDPW